MDLSAAILQNERDRFFADAALVSAAAFDHFRARHSRDLEVEPHSYVAALLAIAIGRSTFPAPSPCPSQS